MKLEMFNSKVDNKKISYYWQGVRQPKGVFHILHGSRENFTKYEPFIKYWIAKKYAIFGMDLRGHGETGLRYVSGYFGKKGYNLVIDDVHQLNTIINKKYPNTKIHLLGHSMGSFIGRAYITKHNDIQSLISIGTNHPCRLTSHVLKFFAKIQNPKKTSKLINKLSYKSYELDSSDPLAWLSLYKKNWENYKKNPYNKFEISNNIFYAFAMWMLAFTSKKKHYNVNKNLPILLLNGADDPVGNFGKDVVKALNFYKTMGFKHVKHIEYPKLRHELIFEEHPEIMYKNIATFLNKYTK